jgi:hypothetical protein
MIDLLVHKMSETLAGRQLEGQNECAALWASWGVSSLPSSDVWLTAFRRLLYKTLVRTVVDLFEECIGQEVCLMQNAQGSVGGHSGG